MLKRIGALLVGVSFFAGLSGCVSADAYRMKEEEVQSLYSVNEDMQARNESLHSEKAGLATQAAALKNENEGLEFRIEKQDKQIAFLKNWGETLEKDGDGLRARMEKLDAKIAELDKDNQRLAILSRPENLLRSLGDRLANLQMRVEALSGENEQLKSRQAALGSEGKKSDGPEVGKPVESAGGKPQAVMVSSGQKAEGSEPRKQSEGELRGPAGDRLMSIVIPVIP